MARKETTVIIGAEGRDQGKQFFIREMPATRVEAWAIRAIGVMQRAGMDIEADIAMAGFAGFVALGLKAFLSAPYDDIRPLLDEMFTCVEAVPDPSVPDRRRPLVENDIEEFMTRVNLRDKVFDLHMGFSVAAVLLTAAASRMTPSPAPSDTPTSDAGSEPLSPAGSPASPN